MSSVFDALALCEGLVSLCAFCEKHGPTTLLSCEKMTASRRGDMIDSEAAASPEKTQRMSRTLFSAPDSSRAACNGCRSMEEGEGFVAYSKGALCATTKFPQSRLYSCVRQIAIRSLSCEHVPGREGPVLFGEEGKGFVLSYPFTIADSQARGFSRTMSLCFMHHDARAVLSATRYIRASFEAILKELKTRAGQLCEKEQQMESGSQSISLRRVHSAAKVRTLAELVGYDGDASGLYRRLHANFCEILFRFEEGLPSAPVSTDGKLGLFQVRPALGSKKFAILLCELLLGRRVEIRYEKGQDVLAEQLWDSLKFLSPSGDSCILIHADGLLSGPDAAPTRHPLRLLVCNGEPAKIETSVGMIAEPVVGLLMRQVYAIIEQKLPLKLERTLLQAAVFEFKALAKILLEQTGRRAYAEYDMDRTVDEVYVKAWAKVQ